MGWSAATSYMRTDPQSSQEKPHMWKWTDNNSEVIPLHVNEEVVFDGPGKIVKKQIDKASIVMFVFVLHSYVIYGEKLAESRSEIKYIFIHVLYVYLGSVHWFWKELRQWFN